MFSLCPFDISVGVGAFGIGLSQIFSCFAFVLSRNVVMPLKISFQTYYFLVFKFQLTEKQKLHNRAFDYTSEWENNPE